MFAVFQKIITHTILLASMIVPALAQAGITDTCFNFLKAQDYARAENEAKQLLQRANLARIDERAAQLCLGRAYYSMGRTNDALPAFQRVEALSQTTQDLATAYNWLGGTYIGLNDLDKAELYEQRALKANRELGDKNEEAKVLNNLAMIVDDRGDSERALKLYRDALLLLPKAERAATLNNIAMIHNDQKKYKQAIKLLRQAIELDRSNGDAHQAATWQINLGGVLKNDKQFVAAEKELLAGLNAIRLVGDKHWEANACEQLAWLANDNPKKTGDEALQWFKQAEALYREIGDTNKTDEIANLLAGK